MDTNVTAALIGAAVATVGSVAFSIWHDWRKERKERGRVASALLVELMDDERARQAQHTLERLRQATSGAAFNGILAIRALDEAASHKRLLNCGRHGAEARGIGAKVCGG